MLTFTLFGFRVTVQPFFWIIMPLLGLSFIPKSAHPVIGIAMWVTVAFISILWHELGHAFAFRRYRIESDIVLHGLGGYAIPHQQPPRLTRRQDIIVSAAGPLFQLAIGLPLLYFVKQGYLGQFIVDRPYAQQVLIALLYVNIAWPILNLLPIFPLDGGRITHALCGPRNEKTALWISFMFAIGVAVLALQKGQGFMGAMFGMMAWNNWCRLTGRPESPM